MLLLLIATADVPDDVGEVLLKPENRRVQFVHPVCFVRTTDGAELKYDVVAAAEWEPAP